MKHVLVALAATLCAPLQAEERPAVNPADPKAPAPPLRYESAFAGFRPAGDDKPAPWKQVNREVEGAGMVGAHGAHGAAQASTPAKPEPDARPAEPPKHRHRGAP